MNLELSRNGKLTPQQLRQQLQQGKLQICGGAVLLACRWSVWMHDGGDFVADRHRQAPSRSADRQFRFGSSELVRYAFRLGAPGGSISLASLAANIPIAALAAPIACKPLASAGRSAESGG